nr:nucleotide-binding alpha-beta plait domain-containing protein [Tanacetum cinerariifolium]
MLLYIKGKEHGRMILNSTEHGQLVYGTIKVDSVTRTKTYEELVDAEKLQDDYDVKATNIILQGMTMHQVQVNTKFPNTLPSEWICMTYWPIHKMAEDMDICDVQLDTKWSFIILKYGAKDLWNTCKLYGHVVDVFIPDIRTKAGKRFGFVCFIKVLDIDHLINNLCTIWVGRNKIHANVARFQREPLHKQSNKVNNKGTNNVNHGEKGMTNSYAHVVKGIQVQNVGMEECPNMVLDETCLNREDFSLCLLGKVKEFASLTNLKVVLGKEGYANIELKCMGEEWHSTRNMRSERHSKGNPRLAQTQNSDKVKAGNNGISNTRHLANVEMVEAHDKSNPLLAFLKRARLSARLSGETSNERVSE